jgi:hypothetical protein
MQYLLLQFAEIPDGEDIDTSMICYDYDLNLNVIKGTNIPAVTFSDQATETFTKTYGEAQDSDKDLQYHHLHSLLDTATATRTQMEGTDRDKEHNNLATLLDTSTQTFVHSEVSDSDKNFKDLSFLSATRTLTETVESVDSDK